MNTECLASISRMRSSRDLGALGFAFLLDPAEEAFGGGVLRVFGFEGARAGFGFLPPFGVGEAEDLFDLLVVQGAVSHEGLALGLGGRGRFGGGRFGGFGRAAGLGGTRWPAVGAFLMSLARGKGKEEGQPRAGPAHPTQTLQTPHS
ncbi:MAG: hypothetical protein M5U12_22335 [Verrucomicrobia bacterium]|nr:hypothetical protein [Verrucomicrobiota bacterium]